VSSLVSVRMRGPSTEAGPTEASTEALAEETAAAT
jgi:hypothetical protein